MKQLQHGTTFCIKDLDQLTGKNQLTLSVIKHRCIDEGVIYHLSNDERRRVIKLARNFK
jgi:hypothetical protein